MTNNLLTDWIYSLISGFRFTGEQVKWITYCLDKYGDDFKAMARDPKNIWQETPKQIRQKVLKFVNIPEQFAVYAKKTGLLDQIVKDSPIAGILEQEKIEIDWKVQKPDHRMFSRFSNTEFPLSMNS